MESVRLFEGLQHSSTYQPIRCVTSQAYNQMYHSKVASLGGAFATEQSSLEGDLDQTHISEALV